VRIGGVVRGVALALVGSVVLAACGASPGSGQLAPRSDGSVAPSPSDAPQTAGRTAPSATGSAAPTVARAAFLSYAFTDVRDGKQFTLSDFAGKQVLVIGMAVW
jgi:hypothetical protein